MRMRVSVDYREGWGREADALFWDILIIFA